MAKSNQPPGVSASSWAINGGKPLEKPAVAKAIAEATARLGDRDGSLSDLQALSLLSA